MRSDHPDVKDYIVYAFTRPPANNTGPVGPTYFSKAYFRISVTEQLQLLFHESFHYTGQNDQTFNTLDPKNPPQAYGIEWAGLIETWDPSNFKKLQSLQIGTYVLPYIGTGVGQ